MMTNTSNLPPAEPPRRPKPYSPANRAAFERRFVAALVKDETSTPRVLRAVGGADGLLPALARLTDPLAKSIGAIVADYVSTGLASKLKPEILALEALIRSPVPFTFRDIVAQESMSVDQAIDTVIEKHLE